MMLPRLPAPAPPDDRRAHRPATVGVTTLGCAPLLAQLAYQIGTLPPSCFFQTTQQFAHQQALAR